MYWCRKWIAWLVLQYIGPNSLNKVILYLRIFSHDNWPLVFAETLSLCLIQSSTVVAFLMCKIETLVAVYGLQLSALKQPRPGNFIRAATRHCFSLANCLQRLFSPCKGQFFKRFSVLTMHIKTNILLHKPGDYYFFKDSDIDFRKTNLP